MNTAVYEAQKASALQAIAQTLQHILHELRSIRQAQQSIAARS
jgi:hypothetical protein